LVYLKALLFACIGLVVAVVLRVGWWFAFAMSHRTEDSRFTLGPRELLHDPLFLVLAVVCIGLVVYLANR
jgi:hypothetical protein